MLVVGGMNAIVGYSEREGDIDESELSGMNESGRKFT